MRSAKEWYRVLLEDQLLISQLTENTPAMLLPISVETLSPENEWPAIWRLARINGLGSQLTSFLFKLLHGLLPTQDRVHRLGVDAGDQPGLCQHCHEEAEDPLPSTCSLLLSHDPSGWTGTVRVCPEHCPNLPNLRTLATICLLVTVGCTSGRPDPIRSVCACTG